MPRQKKNAFDPHEAPPKELRYHLRFKAADLLISVDHPQVRNFLRLRLGKRSRDPSQQLGLVLAMPERVSIMVAEDALHTAFKELRAKEAELKRMYGERKARKSKRVHGARR